MSKNTNEAYLNKPINAGTYETLGYEEVNSSVYSPQNEPLYLINEGYLNSIISNIEGKILTLIEASTEDGEKRSSLKSIAKQMIWQDRMRLLRLKKIK